MTTLTGDKLFGYLTYLEKEVERLSTSPKGNLRALMYSQMRDLITSEIKFLKYLNQNGTEPILSISPNGLPSVESLNPDLEKMCELEEFSEIAQRYQKGIDTNKKDFYVSVSEQEWNKELKNRKKETLPSKIGFTVSETEDGKFELALREECYLEGYDKYSKECPILIRQGKIWYHVVWNRLIEEVKESFYIPNTALVLNDKVSIQKEAELQLAIKNKRIVEANKKVGRFFINSAKCSAVAGEAFGIVTSLPYIIPSVPRLIIEDMLTEGEEEDKKNSIAKKEDKSDLKEIKTVFIAGGTALGLLGIVCQIAGYSFAGYHFGWKVFLPLIATNTLSAGYELIRYKIAKRKCKGSLVERLEEPNSG